jgi:thiosulfate dehydrogenase [quinone] large subunit
MTHLAQLDKLAPADKRRPVQMITTPRRSTSTLRAASGASLSARIVAAARWPFTSRFAAPIWLLVRLYVAYVFLTMGVAKIEAGFLTSDPIGQMLPLVANGTIPVPFEFYRGVAGMLVDAGLTPLISHSMPLLELAVALSLATGVLAPLAAVGALLLNINFVLSGIGQISFDLPYMVAEVLLVAAYPVVGLIGLERLAKRILLASLAKVRPARAQEIVAAK